MLVLLALLTFVTNSYLTAPTIEQFIAQPIPKEAQELSGEALVEYVNKRQPFFKAEYSPTVAALRMGSLMKAEFAGNDTKMKQVLTTKQPVINDEDPPESFDGREYWKDCPSVRYIRDQSNCGSCWAVAAAATMSDRICVQSGGKNKTLISDTDFLACCGRFCGIGCQGGYGTRAWAHAQIVGVCTGGRYQEEGVCMPYPFHPCGFHQGQKYYGECPKHVYKTPVCRKYCQYGYGKRYEADKIRARLAYWVLDHELVIRADIMELGPVQASFTVYEDFAYYKNGIYVHTAGKKKGAHSVKILGWGIENGTKYWTVANSWNTDWGEDGYFRIVRGVNHCGIESEVVTGLF
ncbi:hypothetical protein V3C99_005962 [Haemonchus contortus]|nr:Peptidase C1A domain containing protein [Haemonchus contortus]